MQSPSLDRDAQLAESLHRLVEILRTQQGSTWKDLVQTVSGKTAVIDLDGVQLQLYANGGEQLQVETKYPVVFESVNLRTEAETLRDVVSGRLTLDSAVSQGKMSLRGSFQNLLGVYRVVSGILADSAINPQLRRLWTEFDKSWSHSTSITPSLCLENQKPSYGELIRQIPKDVLEIDISPPPEKLQNT
jgi:hypothetical protein